MKPKPWDQLRSTWCKMHWTDNGVESSIRSLELVTQAGRAMIELHYRVITWKVIAAVGWAFGLLVASAPAWLRRSRYGTPN